MATPNEKLSRLVIGSPCSTSWDGMQGDEQKRHCAQCDRQVHDFSRRTPREIAALLEASRGHLCARLTRTGDGQLLTAEPTTPPPGTWFSRRVSPVAASVVTALLALSGVAAGPLPPGPLASDSAGESGSARPQRSGAGGGGLRGRIVDPAGEPVAEARVIARNTFDGHERSTTTGVNGEFVFDALDAGSYDLEARRDGFTVDRRSDLLFSPGERREVLLKAEPVQGYALGGVILMQQEPLRQVFTESPLVVMATTGPSRALAPEEDFGEVATELLVTSVLKGTAPGRSVRVVHAQSRGETAERFAPGTSMLAFLQPRANEAGRKGETVYESADYHFGLKVLEAGELEAYRERLTALARLLRDGEPHPADLTEWLVATAEEPATRVEGIGELNESLWALDRLARARGTSAERAAQDLQAVAARFERDGGTFGSEPSPALYAAFLTAAQKERLTRALVETRSLNQVDCDLFHLVQPWAQDAALAWLVQRFQDTEPATVEVSRQVMQLLAEGLADPELKTWVETANEYVRRRVIAAGASSDPEARAAEAEKELRERFRQALNRSSAVHSFH